MMGRCRRIGIDVRYLSHGLVGGVHTYVRNLVPALARAAPERRFTLYADAKAPLDLPEIPPGTTVRILPWRNGASSLRGDLRIGSMMRRDGVDLAHFPANYGFAPPNLLSLITLHDAINLLPLHEILRTHPKHPRQMLMMTYLHLMTVAAMRRKPVVVTVSHDSRREILRHAPLPESQVHVVYSAPDDIFQPAPGGPLVELRVRLGLRARVLLADAIKNPACTLRAYRALPAAVRDRTSLVFFARRQPAPAVQQAADDGACILLTRPPREQLVALYTLADLFVFPSWYEGFGLPALEAMACGTPVIASSRGGLPEVVGDGGVIVDAEDHGAIARSILTLFDSPDRYARLRAAALAHAARFSWDNTARQMLAIYDDAAAASERRSHVSVAAR